MLHLLFKKLYMFLAVLKRAGDDKEKEVEYLLKAADLGHARAQNELGLCYASGSGVEVDLIEAVKWYKKAADQGDMYAQGNIAMAYYKGEGVTQSYELALEWYKKAANQGHKESQYNLGLIYADDLKEENVVESVRWLSKAESNGIKEATNALEKIRQRNN